MNLIDINKYNTAIDWKNTYQADDGTLFRKYECSYEFQGKTWNINIWARNLEECLERMNAIGQGQVLGIVIEEIKP